MTKDKTFNIRMDSDTLIKVKAKCVVDETPLGTLITMFLESYANGQFGILFGNLITLNGSMKGMSRSEIERVYLNNKKDEAVK